MPLRQPRGADAEEPIHGKTDGSLLREADKTSVTADGKPCGGSDSAFVPASLAEICHAATCGHRRHAARSLGAGTRRSRTGPRLRRRDGQQGRVADA